jgi:porin
MDEPRCFLEFHSAMSTSNRLRAGFLALAVFLMMPPGRAQEENAALPLQDRDQILGEWVTANPMLTDRGVTLFGGYLAEVWGNTSGGIETGAVYTGLLDFGVELDLEKVIGWQGASASTTWLWLSGRDASEDLVGNFLTISNAAGFNTLRMLEMWFQQNLLEDAVSIRFGQLTADSEFLISDYGGLFLNATFGWAPLAYMNIPAGGPGSPMGAPGVRVAVSPVDWFTFLSAVFQGNVFAQDVNRHGFRWRLDAQQGFTFFNEAQIRWNQREEETGLPGQFKAGAWFQTGESADVLADSTASGNSGYYFIIDQMLVREWDGAPPPQEGSGKNFKEPMPAAKPDQGLGWFSRMGFAPSDRNFVDYYFDAGFTYKGLVPGRDNDTAGVAFGYAQLSAGAQGGIADGGGTPAGAEMALEVTYQAEITPWLVVQPDVQYIINPGGATDLPNAFVIGCRASVVF